MFRSLLFLTTLVLAGVPAVGAQAADAAKGKRLAQRHCAFCHAITSPAPDVVAASPPFEVIGRKYGFAVTAIAYAIAGPHPKMNFSPSAAEAADIAAFIATLKQ